jgi:hypothetical protein
MTAAYQGTDDFGASTSASLNQVVYPATTTTSLTSSRNPAVVHQLVTYAATVASQYGGAVTGTVTFQDSGSTIATVSLSGNQATYTTSYKATGSHLITTAYLGDTDNTASTSHGLTQTISSFSSKTVVTTSGSPAFVGQPITFTATVTSPGGTIPDGELVTFSDGTATLASVPLSGGTAAYTISSLSAKAHVINAAYPGDAAFGLSAATVQQLVQRYPTTTTLVSNLNPSVFGQAVTLTATVTSAGPDMPTGNVVFKDGTLALGTVALSGGIATLTTLARSFAARTLDAGTHSITAEYEGNSASAKSGSPVVNQIVSQASTTTTITSTRNPWPKGMLYFVATVRSSTGASVGGKVTFTAGNATRTELIHSRGKAVTFTLFLPPGSYTVTATYSGGTNFTGSSASMTQVVQ